MIGLGSIICARLGARRSARDKAMYRKALPRIYELRDIAQNPPSREAYFSDFDGKLEESPVRLKHFRDIEAELQGLGAAAWHDLKARIVPLLTAKREKRGWQPLFDTLNEVKGYNHLAGIGCTNIRFIPVPSVRGQKSPDLSGDLEGAKVLCEVKTINISEAEATRRTNGAAGSIGLHLPVEFFQKLRSTLESATKQMAAYDADTSIRRIVYVVVTFDDNLHEYADDYSRQIERFVAAKPVPEIDVAFHIKPPFYSATR
jgi:hypothetical protein